MKKLKPVEIFTDVTCKNCASYDQRLCCKDSPAISTEPDNKCSEGEWLFKGSVINFRKLCLELLPIDFVTDVDDLICKNCVSYDLSKQECHFHRQDIFKSGSDDWCDNGMWLYQEKDDEVILVSLSFFYPVD
jgi:hypothetical protein